MIKITETKTYERYIEGCPICGMKIKGSTESQVKYNLMIHKIKCKKENKQ